MSLEQMLIARSERFRTDLLELSKRPRLQHHLSCPDYHFEVIE